MSRPLRVLVVEDDPALSQLYVELLADGGHSARAASDGREALALLGDDVDLVITDLQMPGMNGDAFLRELRSRRAPVTPPVLVVTAFPADLPATLKDERTTVLRKPFRLDAFVSYVEAVANAAQRT